MQYARLHCTDASCPWEEHCIKQSQDQGTWTSLHPASTICQDLSQLNIANDNFLCFLNFDFFPLEGRHLKKSYVAALRQWRCFECSKYESTWMAEPISNTKICSLLLDSVYLAGFIDQTSYNIFFVLFKNELDISRKEKKNWIAIVFSLFARPSPPLL